MKCVRKRKGRYMLMLLINPCLYLRTECHCTHFNTTIFPYSDERGQDDILQEKLEKNTKSKQRKTEIGRKGQATEALRKHLPGSRDPFLYRWYKEILQMVHFYPAAVSFLVSSSAVSLRSLAPTLTVLLVGTHTTDRCHVLLDSASSSCQTRRKSMRGETKKTNAFNS